MRKLTAASVLLVCGLGMAQEADPIRIDHYTKQDLQRIADADAVIELAHKARAQVAADINREHGFLDPTGNCTPYDEVSTRGKDTLIVERITPQRDKDGDCSDGSGEGFSSLRRFAIND